jgi:catechol 2,3-dioxygenase-like lactoylglutathione lyase family enzyme
MQVPRTTWRWWIVITEATVYVTLPAADYDRARHFWGDQLGFEVESENPGGTSYKSGAGTSFLVFPSGGKASGDHTQAAFRVSDIEKAVADLQSRGVIFEDYDTPQLKTVNGIATTGPARGAWFKDSEGNMIGVVEMPG